MLASAAVLDREIALQQPEAQEVNVQQPEPTFADQVLIQEGSQGLGIMHQPERV